MNGAAAGIGGGDTPAVDAVASDALASDAVASDAVASAAMGRDDQPDIAIFNGAGGIAQRWFGATVGVAVIMADDAESGAARGTMRVQQCGRVDLETAGRIGGDVARRHHIGNAAGRAEQQAATFLVRRDRCLRQKGFVHPTCNFNDHANIG